MAHCSPPGDEAARLAALRRYAILDTTPEEPFDRLASLAATLLDAPVAFISFIDRTRQWFKARHGLHVTELPRDVAPCSALLQSSKSLLILTPDNNPELARACAALGVPEARFFAAVPLRTVDGWTLGSLAVLDRRPRRLSATQQRCLQEISTLILQEMEHRSEVQSLQSALHQSEERFQLFTERAQDYAVMMLDPAGRITTWNGGAERISGYRGEEVLGRHISLLYLPEDVDAGIPARRLECAEKNGFTEHEDWCLRRDGSRFRALNTLTALRDANGALRGFCKITRDLTQHRQAEEQIAFLAHHDLLTGLPNRHLFREKIAQAIARAYRNHRKIGVLLLDLDRFKHVNESLGHKQGDQLLKMVAERLQTCVRDGDMIARQGGDEFILLVPDINGHEDLSRIANRLIGALQAPFLLGHHEVYVTPSIGASIFPDDGTDYELLLKHADIAMYQAKTHGRNRFQVFLPSMAPNTPERISLEADLHKALSNSEFLLYYQPQIAVHSGRVIGVEALLRWQHPQRGLILPGDFIPLAEETGLIVPIGEWVVRTACQQCQQWARQGFTGLRVAVNLSLRQFQQPDLISGISNVLYETGIAPHVLELEITESMAVEEADHMASTLHKIKALGVQLALDDFGTGYSSLNYLKQLPIDTVKIDRSFIRTLESDARGAAITRGIIHIAHSLNITVIAEGVDTPQQLDFLRQHRCDALQGFLISRPIPPEALTELLQRSGRSVLRRAA